MNKPKHCLAPFSSINLTPGGAQVCCYHSQPVHPITSIADWWQSDTMIALRQKLRAGVYEGVCKACVESGRFGGYTMYNRYETDTAPDVPPIEEVQLVNLCVSNKCNLACRTCNPMLSSSYGSLGVKLGYVDKDAAGVRRLPWHLIEEVAALRPSVVLVAGGEPTLDPLFHDAIKLFGPESTLHLITNGVNYNPEFFKTLLHPNAHNRVTFSLDGGRNLNNYIRVFGDFDKTIASMKRMKASYPWVPLEICLTISSLSVWGIGEFVEDVVEALGEAVGDTYIHLNYSLYPVEYRLSQLAGEDKKRMLAALADGARTLAACVKAHGINPRGAFVTSLTYSVFQKLQDVIGMAVEPDKPAALVPARNKQIDDFLRIEVLVDANRPADTAPGV